jgi:predicted lactoylglutathione lyase
MEQQVQQHQITDTQSGQEITSSLTKRKIGMILKDVQTKLTELVWMEPEEKEGL